MYIKDLEHHKMKTFITGYSAAKHYELFNHRLIFPSGKVFRRTLRGRRRVFISYLSNLPFSSPGLPSLNQLIFITAQIFIKRH